MMQNEEVALIVQFVIPNHLPISASEKKIPVVLTLKAPVMTAADDIHKYFFIVFQRK